MGIRSKYKRENYSINGIWFQLIHGNHLSVSIFRKGDFYAAYQEVFGNDKNRRDNKMIIQIIELLATGTAIVIGITLVVLGIAIWWAGRKER